MSSPSPGKQPERTGPDTPEADLEDAMQAVEQQLSMLWRRTRAISHHLSRSVHPEMEPSAYGLLTILQREGSMRLTDLAAAIGVGKPSVSRQIAFLESLGLVRKEADPLDGRAQAITLTAEGSAKMRSVQTARREVFHHLLSDWPREDLEDFARLMGKLNAEYDKEGARDG